MDKKRIAFSESEKVRLRELVMERRDVVENRKSDVNSQMEKKRAWDVITADFNSSGQFPNRSVVQLKRLWENVKARRKAQLSAEKRERFKTGGGPSAQIADEDAELDSLGVDVEIVDAFDSDTGRLAPRSVEVVGMDEIQENMIYECNVVHEEPDEIAIVEGEEAPAAQGSKRASTNPEVISRIKRNEEFNRRAGEIHVLKMKEQQQKVELAYMWTITTMSLFTGFWTYYGHNHLKKLWYPILPILPLLLEAEYSFENPAVTKDIPIEDTKKSKYTENVDVPCSSKDIPIEHTKKSKYREIVDVPCSSKGKMDSEGEDSEYQPESSISSESETSDMVTCEDIEQLLRVNNDVQILNSRKHKWMIRNPGCAISISEVAGIFKEAWIRAATMSTAINGFRETGIYPFNRNAIPDHFYAPAETTDHPLPPRDEQAFGGEESVQHVDPQPCSSSSETTDHPLPPTDGQALGEESVQHIDPQPCSSSSSAAACGTPRSQFSRPTSSGSSSFQFSPEDIRPFPKESEKRKKRINKNRGATAILTASPYKAKLQDAETSKKKAKPNVKNNLQKNEQPNVKGVTAGKKRGRPKGKKNKKRTVQQDFSSDEESNNEEWQPSTDDENDSGDACMYCDQLLCETPLSESWSMCTAEYSFENPAVTKDIPIEHTKKSKYREIVDVPCSSKDIPIEHTKKSKYREIVDVPGSSKGTRKKTRRAKHCCKFCLKVIENFPRHLRNQHHSEDEVKALLALPLLAEFRNERHKIIHNIKVEGDAYHNVQHPTDQIVGEGGKMDSEGEDSEYQPESSISSESETSDMVTCEDIEQLLRVNNDVQILNSRKHKMQNRKRTTELNSTFDFPPLYRRRPRIPKDKWTDLQSLKSLLPSDTHGYYDDIPHEEQSRRQVKRQEAVAKTEKKRRRLLMKLWTFNRRRVSEVDKLRLLNWQRGKEIDEDSPQFKCLSTSEQLCASSFIRLTVQGKLRRTVALLVAKKDIPKFEMMIEHRKKAGVTQENKYLFAVRNRYMEGTHIMSQFAAKCGANQPELLTGARLRKHLAAGLRKSPPISPEIEPASEPIPSTSGTSTLDQPRPSSSKESCSSAEKKFGSSLGNYDLYSGEAMYDILDVKHFVVPDSFFSNHGYKEESPQFYDNRKINFGGARRKGILYNRVQDYECCQPNRKK
ncbi:hypothetical protein GE061_019001 [Apolygus lucorum]|uniref:Regulatory protein zeste n=1 Tax=Apolygus lucorum TaxID=248454 RepID=A0A8S9X919_APOLU|nr:hypothetical protein GE061_019001 [Apolygus lucorum]